MKYKLRIAPTWYFKALNHPRIGDITKTTIIKEWNKLVNDENHPSWDYAGKSMKQVINEDIPLNKAFHWSSTTSRHDFWENIFQIINDRDRHIRRI